MALKSFDDLFQMAAARKGGIEAFEAMLPEILTPKKLSKIPDDRWLSMFSRGIFQTGLNWKVVENSCTHQKLRGRWRTRYSS